LPKLHYPRRSHVAPKIRGKKTAHQGTNWVTGPYNIFVKRRATLLIAKSPILIMNPSLPTNWLVRYK
ncbi:MAG: hypothetical protein KDD35_13205, partial [Bdellovibrionales bacterium]|nr:hypothetical protein [Bdellovibrionales bacterium]